jgi:hypothetical protein
MWLFVGKTETGKSVFIREMFYHLRKIFPFGIIFSHTKHNNFWQQHFPNWLIVPRFHPGILRKIIDAQKARHGAIGRNTKIFILGDDIASEQLQVCPCASRSYTLYRHVHTSFRPGAHPPSTRWLSPRTDPIGPPHVCLLAPSLLACLLCPSIPWRASVPASPSPLQMPRPLAYVATREKTFQN